MAKKDAEVRSRSTAAQFFMEEDPSVEQKSTNERVVEMLNEAAMTGKDQQKVITLKQVQEMIVYQQPDLLDNFLDEMLNFQQDRSVDVRKFVVGFIEEACKKDHEVLPKVIANLSLMLNDETPAIQKRVIQAASQLYKVSLKWLSKSRLITAVMESTWIYMCKIKETICSGLDSENDGIRTHAIKFMETLVLVQTVPEPDYVKKEGEFTLDDIPSTSKLLKPTKLEKEAKEVFDKLIVFHGSPHISSVNLMACMGSLAHIAKLRPDFMSKVVQALESVHANLPPTLARSQVNSVRKHLKLQLLGLLKSPHSGDFHPHLTTLLTDLGATQQEVMKYMPRPEELRKRVRVDDTTASSKRLKTEKGVDDKDDDDEDEEPEERKPSRILSAPKTKTETAIDITAEFLFEKLQPENTCDVVLLSMVSLPEEMPSSFQATYTPIAAAGTEGQIWHVARLLAAQFTAAGVGPGVEAMKQTADEVQITGEEELSSVKNTIQTVIGGAVGSHVEQESDIVLSMAGSQFQQKPGKRSRQLRLTDVTKPFSPEQRERLMIGALQRLMKHDKIVNATGTSWARTKLVSLLTTLMDTRSLDAIKDYIFDDLRTRCDLAFAWLYEEYSVAERFSYISAYTRAAPSMDKYNSVLCGLIKSLMGRPELKDREIYLTRLYLEAPAITDGAVIMLKAVCQDEVYASVGMNVLMDLTVKRIPKQMQYLEVILELTGYEVAEVRNEAIRVANQLFLRSSLRQPIEDYALTYLKFLLLPEPPAVLFGEERGRPIHVVSWVEDICKICLYLYLSLLPSNHQLIHDLALVYVTTSADIKRTILRVLEVPVRGMGMDSPELLKLVETCPKGSETLVTRIIHILTDKLPPSPELVARVRDLYHKRVPDVRFLIPVLNGLSKREVMDALPKLIKLNPVVVKEVFNRLLGSHAESSVNFTSPLTPVELLISLHNIDTTKCDMKTIIKATSLCFTEKQIYTQEVLAVVMQQLMEQNPLPTLLMRTVILSLSLFPRLIGFVMNILQRLIQKQVWKQKKVWEGFIKCCQRTKPQSFQVILQLPPEQLQNVLDVSPDLREPLKDHINLFTPHQRAHISAVILDIVACGVGNEPLPPGDLVYNPMEQLMPMKMEQGDSENSVQAPPAIKMKIKKEKSA